MSLRRTRGIQIVTNLSHDEGSFFAKKRDMKVTLFSVIASTLMIATLFGADITLLETKAREGDPNAQFELARIYLRGSDGVRKDVIRSLELMKGAADQGHAEAMGGVGYFYASGTAVPKDDTAALTWFRKGAEAGGAKAQLNLGKMLAEGKGTEKNEVEGRKWIKTAADQGQVDAAFAMGQILYFGDIGQEVDYKAAYPYLLVAAEAGNPDAQNIIGVMLENAKGVDMDAALAEQWYRKAAKQGHNKAQSNLGLILGPEVDERERRLESLTWLLVATRKGEITAQKMLEQVREGVRPEDMAQAEQLVVELEKSLKMEKDK
jgi:TPR repeat protein